MSIKLQMTMILLSILLLCFIVYNSKKSMMNVRYAVIWIIGACCILVLSIFPDILDLVAEILNISQPVTALFLIGFMIAYILIFYIYVKISYLEKRINNLTYANAILNKEIDESNGK